MYSLPKTVHGSQAGFHKYRYDQGHYDNGLTNSG